MFQKYKEIFFGLAFGIGAVILDTGMDAMADGNSLMDEVTEHPGMLLYRAVFIVLGLLLGWLLWQEEPARTRVPANQPRRCAGYSRNAENRQCSCARPCKICLIRDDVHLSDAASQVVQEAYQKTQELQTIAEQKLPPAWIVSESSGRQASLRRLFRRSLGEPLRLQPPVEFIDPVIAGGARLSSCRTHARPRHRCAPPAYAPPSCNAL